MLDLSCPQCRTRYQVPETSAGRKGKCKVCGNVLEIPTPSAPPPAMDDLLGEMAAEKPRATQPAPSYETIQPMPSPRISYSEPKGMLMTWIEQSPRAWHVALVLGVMGGVLLFVGYREWRLGSLAKQTPQKITLADLAARGPGDNIYLELTEVQLLPEAAVIETKQRTVGPSGWSYVWIPAVPLSQKDPETASVKVIIGTKDCHEAQDLIQFCGKTTFTGLIVNATDSLGSEEHKLLNEGMQGFDAASCYFFRVGQSPIRAGFQFLIIAAGVLVVSAALVLTGLLVKVRYLEKRS